MAHLRQTTMAMVLAAMMYPAVAQAQIAAAPAAPERKGFVIGFAMGPGRVSCDTCETKSAFGLSLHIGGMLTPRVALLYDSDVLQFTHHNVPYSSGVSGVGLQYFASNRAWVKGGIGSAILFVDHHSGDSHLGLFAGAGVELVQKRRFAMDLSGRFSMGRSPGSDIRNLSVKLGFNWY